MKRKSIIGLLVLLVLLISGLTYAYWVFSITFQTKDAQGSIIDSGKGSSVETTITINGTSLSESGKKLVPKDYVFFADQVDNIDIEFINITWGEGMPGISGATGTLTIEILEFKIGDIIYTKDINGLYGGMFTITPQVDLSITAQVLKVVSINVEFTNEPPTQEIYEAIENQELHITFKFGIIPN